MLRCRFQRDCARQKIDSRQRKCRGSRKISGEVRVTFFEGRQVEKVSDSSLNSQPLYTAALSRVPTLAVRRQRNGQMDSRSLEIPEYTLPFHATNRNR